MHNSTIPLSRPQDPTTLSFLDLPAELRNWIYELWFEYTAPFILDVESSPVELSFRAYDFRIILPVHALRICRQMHHEAASVLYANTFYLAIPRPWTNVNRNNTINSAALWLQQVGRHKQFVRKLVLLLQTLSPSPVMADSKPVKGTTFYETDGCIAVGPLLHLVWNHDLDISILFANSLEFERHDHDILLQRTVKKDEIAPFDIYEVFPGELTEYCRALLNDINVKRCRRAIHDIGIHETGLCGYLIFRTTKFQTPGFQNAWNSCAIPNPFFEQYREFALDKNDLIKYIDRCPASFLSLPKPVLRKIVKLTLSAPQARNLDLDTWYNFQDIWGILYTNRHLHDTYIPTLVEYMIDISMTTSSIKGIFEYDKLSRLLSTYLSYAYTVNEPRTLLFGMKAEYTISMHFHLNTSTSLDDIRINATDLIAATFQSHPARTIAVILHTPTTTTSHIFTIRTLRRTVLPALQHFVKTTNRGARERYPDMWITGQCELVEVVSRGVLPKRWRGEEGDLRKVYRTLWTSAETGVVGEIAPTVPGGENGGDLARGLYLWLRWVCVGSNMWG